MLAYLPSVCNMGAKENAYGIFGCRLSAATIKMPIKCLNDKANPLKKCRCFLFYNKFLFTPAQHKVPGVKIENCKWVGYLELLKLTPK